MSNNYIQSLSDKHNIPIKELESLWDSAKKEVDDKENYALITHSLAGTVQK